MVPGHVDEPLCCLPIESPNPHPLAWEIHLGSDGQLMIRVLRGETFTGVTIDHEVLKEAQKLAEQMRVVFELPKLEVASRFDHEEFVEAIAKLHPELLFVRREKRRDAFSNGQMEITLGRNSRLQDRVEATLVMDTHSLPGRGVKQTLNIATHTLPVRLAVLEKLNIGEWAEGNIVLHDDTSMLLCK